MERTGLVLDVSEESPGRRPALEVPPPLGVDRHDGVTVDTSRIRLTSVPGNHLAVIESLSGASRNLLLSITEPDGTRRIATTDRMALEHNGWMRAVLRLDGRVVLENHQSLMVTVRLQAFLNSPVVRLGITVRNENAATHPGGFWDLGDPRSILLRDVSLEIPRLPTEESRGVLLSEAHGTPPRIREVPVELYQDSSGGSRWQSTNHLTSSRALAVSFRGYRLRAGSDQLSGDRSTPCLLDGDLGLVIPEFWQNFPQALEVDEEYVRWRLFPRQSAHLHEVQPGEQKTHECWLSFGPDRVSEQSLDWCVSPVTITVDPEWTVNSGAVPFLSQLDAAHEALVSSAVDGPESFENKREVIDEYGWRNFGEIYGDHESIRQSEPPIVSHYNNQYDPLAGFILQYLRTADRRWWKMADELARHVMDIDVYHTEQDKSAYNHGLFWHTYHYGDADTATHRTYPSSARGKTHGGGPSADHNYTTGLMLHYFLTGDEASRTTVIELAQYVCDMDDGRLTPFRWLDRGDTGRAILSAAGYYGPGRAPANSLNALLDAHRLTGRADFLVKAEQIIRRVVHPTQPIADLRLGDPETRWFYTMFLQALGKYLHYKGERNELDQPFAYARASLLHFANWMAENEHPYLDKPEKLEFPTETWVAQDIRKSDVFYHAALHSSGPARDRFLERAVFFHWYSVDTLTGLPTRTLARPVVVLLTSGFMHGWTLANGGASAPAGPDLGTTPPFRPFVPQRVNAERRAKMAAALGAIVAVMLALAWAL